tara:strand:+ start:196 stop:711 length:516 start_codon:yes stop_codon:yes gene_type:complete
MICKTNCPRIYVACLASYNSGILYGAWIDCDQSEEDIRDAISEMLADSPTEGAEEYAIHDYEGWQGATLYAYHDIGELSDFAELLEEHGEAYALWCAHVGADYGNSGNEFQDAYCGEWSSELEYAEHIIDECYTLEGIMAQYFDYEAFARDLFMDMFSIESSGHTVYVFDN